MPRSVQSSPCVARNRGFSTRLLGLHFGKADALNPSGGAGRVRRLAWVVVIIIGLGVAVVLPLLTLGVQRGVHCGARVVSASGPSGQRLQCICLEGVLATCFEPFDQDPDAVPRP